MTTTATTAGETSAEQVIAAAIHEHEIETGAAIRKLQLAVEWVRLHPARRSTPASSGGCGAGRSPATVPPRSTRARSRSSPLAIGHSTDSGRRYLGTRWSWRIGSPGLGAGAGREVAVWKARRIAQATMPPAGWVRRPSRSGPVLRGRAVLVCGDRPAGRRPARHDPVETNADGRGRGEAAREGPPGAMTYDRLVPITAMADVPDAVAFETTRHPGREMDPAIPLQVRRSMVLGMLGSRHGDAVRGSAPG